MSIPDICLLPFLLKTLETWLKHGGGGQGVNREAERVSATWSSGTDIQAGVIQEVPGDPTHVGKPPLGQMVICGV